MYYSGYNNAAINKGNNCPNKAILPWFLREVDAGGSNFSPRSACWQVIRITLVVC